MEKNKRTKNAILLWFIWSLLTIVILISIIILKLKTDIEQVEEIKLSLKNDYEYFNTTSKTWISFTDFKWLANSDSNIKNNLYITSVINTIDQDFYSKNILNNSQLSFDNYINNKQKYLDSISNKTSIKEQKLNKILPIYSDNLSLSNDWVMNDFHLVNKIESIFKTFDLSYWDKISINTISPVKWFESPTPVSENIDDTSSDLVEWEENVVEQPTYSNSTNLIQSDIFFIPMVLHISWTKLNLQNFLHYVENVWSFKIVSNDIEFYDDDLIKNNKSWKVILYNDDYKSWQKYYIYNNQLINITSVKFDNAFLDENIWLNESTSLDVEIELFVRWLPNYKMRELIDNFIYKYENFNKSIDSKILKLKVSSNSTDSQKLDKLLKIKSYIITMDSDIKALSSDSGNVDNLWASYKKFLEYNLKFLNLKSLFDKI